MEIIWNSDPPDGVLCLIATRRVLDINNHCCDYNRCAATKTYPVNSTYDRVDRCLLEIGHEGQHHGLACRNWK